MTPELRRCLVSLAGLGLVVLAVFTVSSCTSAPARQAAARGAAEAGDDISNGRARLLFLGLPATMRNPLDPETGLLRSSHGCCVDDASTAYVEAYNAAVLGALREGRLEGQTFEMKATTRAALDARFAASAPERVELGARPATAPDGRYSVELAPRHHPQAPADETPYLFVIDIASGRRQELDYVVDRAKFADVLFADGGSTLCVRWERGGFQTFDLPHAIPLQEFPAPGRR